ncbi:MAG: HEAT repeat domain-containing protein [Chloroflexota bacterium]|nr:HEAT repeat domain-containing protein [Chloroflexota bacterium]
MNALERIDALMDSLSRYQAPTDYAADPLSFHAAGNVLIELLGDDDPSARESAARALGDYADVAEQIGAFAADLAVRTRVVDALTAAVEDDDWGTRQSAAEMLVHVGAGGKTEALARLAADLEADDAEIRLGAAYSLAHLHDPRGGEALVQLMGHWNQRISGAAALGLAEMGDRRAIPPLQAAMYSPDDQMRQAAHGALQRLGAG